MNKVIFILFAVLVFTSCGSDEDNFSPNQPGENADSNTGSFVDTTPGANNKNANGTKTNAYTWKLEFPALQNDSNDNDHLLVHTTTKYGMNYAIEWCHSKRAQRWTCYEMYASNSVKNWNRNDWASTDWKGDPFQVDRMLNDSCGYCTTELSDYRGSGFNRGHICPSADRLNSQVANEQTFYLSNMQPQKYEFNAGIWGKMEIKLRQWNIDSFRDTLYICKGGTIADVNLDGKKVSGIKEYTKSGLPVPRYFYMAVLCVKDGKYKAMAFWAEHLYEDHSKDALINYAISVDELEKRTGIDFFCNLPDVLENSVESNFKISDWNW